MDVSPQSIRQVEFREKLRGYHQDDVDEFLERVAAAFEIMQERLRQANERALRAETAASESRGDDEALRKTLVLAQRTADMAVQEAREEAARLLDAAESEAAAMREEADEESRRLLEDSHAQARAEVDRLQDTRRQLDEDIERLHRYLDEQRARAKSVLTDAAANLDAALVTPPRPVSYQPPPPAGVGAGPSVPYGSAEPALDDDRSFDRDLLAEVIERSRDESDTSRGFWRRPS